MANVTNDVDVMAEDFNVVDISIDVDVDVDVRSHFGSSHCGLESFILRFNSKSYSSVLALAFFRTF